MESPSLLAASPSPAALPRVPSSVFEGMFLRGLEPSEVLAEALRHEGYDPRCPDVTYSILLWKRCVERTRHLLYAGQSDAEAYRLLGRKLVEGFAETLVGRVAAVALPMIGPASLLERLPRYLALMGRSDLEIRRVSLGERARSLTVPDRFNRPEFMVGALEVALERTQARPTVLVEERSPGGYRLLVRW